MRNIGLLLLFAVSACSSHPRLPSSPQGTAVLEVRGAIKGGPYALGRADLERLPQLHLRGEDPRTGTSAVWEGTSVVALVSDRVDLRKGADTVIVRSADRSAVPVPMTVIRQLKPVLADRADGTRTGTRVLAWPTEQQKGLARDPRAAAWWARDVVALEIVEWQRTFGPALAAPDGASDAARRGSGVYAESCVSCHRLRGVGGERGPDLTTVAARIRAATFTALLPSHPGWHERPVADPGSAAATELWNFLQSVADSSVAAATTWPPEIPPAVEPLTADRSSAPVGNTP